MLFRSHVNEKGCAVIEAVENGQVPEKRYQNYIKIKKESMRSEERRVGKECRSRGWPDH